MHVRVSHSGKEPELGFFFSFFFNRRPCGSYLLALSLTDTSYFVEWFLCPSAIWPCPGTPHCNDDESCTAVQLLYCLWSLSGDVPTKPHMCGTAVPLMWASWLEVGGPALQTVSGRKRRNSWLKSKQPAPTNIMNWTTCLYVDTHTGHHPQGEMPLASS